jgi:hypothetical protein
MSITEWLMSRCPLQRSGWIEVSQRFARPFDITLGLPIVLDIKGLSANETRESVSDWRISRFSAPVSAAENSVSRQPCRFIWRQV